MASPNLALPGTPLSPFPQQSPGNGTHIYSSQVLASLAGPIATTRPRKNTPATVSVARNANTLPSVDSIVLARVTRLQTRQAIVEVLVVYPPATESKGDATTTSMHLPPPDSGVALPRGFQGIIRSQDVRATQKDSVKIAESFAVGDIVRGVVISLGDTGGYYVSTARNELGVLMARSAAGERMVPVSWKEFQEVGSGRREVRKVAKPV